MSNSSSLFSDSEDVLDAAELLRNLNTKNYGAMNRIFESHLSKITNIPPPMEIQLVPQAKALRVNACGAQFIKETVPHVEGSAAQLQSSRPARQCACGCTQLRGASVLEKLYAAKKKLLYCCRQQEEEFFKDKEDGELRFESRFEAGNLFSAQRVQLCANSTEAAGKLEFGSLDHFYLLYLQADSNSASHSQWFNFLVRGGIPGTRYVIVIANFVKSKSAYQTGMQPLLSEDFGPFQRVGSEVFYGRNSWLPKEDFFSRHSSLVFSLQFNSSGVAQVIQNYPYTLTRLASFLNESVLREFPQAVVTHGALAQTICQNEMDVISITGKPASLQRPVIVITARIHPGETQASYMAEGMMQFLLSGEEDANSLLKEFEFIIVPMVNPDGVVLGNYRCNYAGRDLNRQWHQPSRIFSPCILAVQEKIKTLVLQQQRTVTAFIDLHGHFKKQSAFGYSVQDDGYFQLLHKTSKYFDFTQCRLGYQKGKKHTGRVVNQDLFGLGRSYCIECSFYGWTDKTKGAGAGAGQRGGEAASGETECDKSGSESEEDSSQRFQPNSEKSQQDSDSSQKPVSAESDSVRAALRIKASRAQMQAQQMLPLCSQRTPVEKARRTPIQQRSLPPRKPPLGTAPCKAFTQDDLRAVGRDIVMGMRCFLPGMAEEVAEIQQQVFQEVGKPARNDEESDSDEDLRPRGKEDAGQKLQRIMEKQIGFVPPVEKEKRIKSGKEPQKQVAKAAALKLPETKRAASTAPSVRTRAQSQLSYSQGNGSLFQPLSQQPASTQSTLLGGCGTTRTPRVYSSTNQRQVKTPVNIPQSKPAEPRRIIYEKVIDLQKEKQKFEYEFYHRYPQTQRSIPPRNQWKITSVANVTGAFAQARRSFSVK